MNRSPLRLACVLVAAAGALMIDRAVPRESAYVLSPEWLWVKDKGLGYRNRPSATYHHVMADAWVNTGPHGERRTVPEGDRRAPVILVAGDSTTCCAELDDGATGVSWLARLRRDRRFVNLGVRGYNTIQSMLLVDEWLEREPRATVLYVWCSNDRIENVRPDSFGRPPCPTWWGGARVDWTDPWPWPYEPGAGWPEVTPLLVKAWRDRLAERGSRLVVSAFAVERENATSPCVDLDPREAFTDAPENYRKRLADGTLDAHWNERGARTWARAVAGRLP